MSTQLDQAGQDLLFNKARTYSAFKAQDVSDELLHRAWDLARMGPTSVNCQPVRIVFVSDGAKSHPNSRSHPPERLRSLREKEALSACAAGEAPGRAAALMETSRLTLIELLGRVLNAYRSRNLDTPLSRRGPVASEQESA